MRAPASLRAAAHVVESVLRRRLDPEWVPLPHAAHVILTWRCNLRCVRCGSWKVRTHDELSAADWRVVFRQLRSLDVVKILGGEPCVRDDLAEVLSAVRAEIAPRILQLTTNGMFGDRLVSVLRDVAWPGLQLRVSLDGTEPTHDAQRGVPGSWQRVMDTLRRVAELRPQLGFSFGINFAVTDRSIDELDTMFDLAEQLGATLVPGVPVRPFLDGRVPPEQLEQQVVDIADPARMRSRLTHHRPGPARDTLDLAERTRRRLAADSLRDQLRGQRRFVCRELRDLIYVHPNGDLVRCGRDERPITNLRHTPLAAVWRGPELRAWRERVDACPGCMQGSIQILSRVYAGARR